MRSWLMAAAAFGLLATATPALAACDLAASYAAHAGDAVDVTRGHRLAVEAAGPLAVYLTLSLFGS